MSLVCCPKKNSCSGDKDKTYLTIPSSLTECRCRGMASSRPGKLVCTETDDRKWQEKSDNSLATVIRVPTQCYVQFYHGRSRLYTEVYSLYVQHMILCQWSSTTKINTKYLYIYSVV